MVVLVETLQGSGQVFWGDRFLMDVQYEIRIYQHYDESHLLSGETLRTPTVQSIELKTTEAVEAGLDELLTLRLRDSRKLDFRATGKLCVPFGGLH